MASIPDDFLFYYNTTNGETHYFSACYWVRAENIRIIEIEEDEMWTLVSEGNLRLMEISPADFPHTLPSNISGTVKTFVIRS